MKKVQVFNSDSWSYFSSVNSLNIGPFYSGYLQTGTLATQIKCHKMHISLG